jgi:hypothetical protein
MSVVGSLVASLAANAFTLKKVEDDLTCQFRGLRRHYSVWKSTALQPHNQRAGTLAIWAICKTIYRVLVKEN